MSFLLPFLVYLSIILIIALSVHRKSQTEADFVIGNRSLNFWVTALSAHAADMSAWLFMALPMLIFTGGMPNAWVALGLIGGMWLNWQFIAPKLRTETERLNAFTLSTYLERRYHDETGTLRLITSVISLFFLTWYLSAGLIAMGNLFEHVFGIPYLIGILITLGVVVLYTYVGGFVTVCWLDLFQGIFLLAMILFVPILAFIKIGGFTAVIDNASKSAIPLSLMEDFSYGSFFAIVSSALGWGLGYFGQPHILSKFMGIKTPSDLVKSKYLGMSWQILALSGSVFVGLIAIGFFNEGVVNPELIYVVMVKELFTPFFAGIVLCGMVAANISTMDSQLLVASSVISEDIYKKLFSHRASSKQLLIVSRLGVLVLAFIALLIAIQNGASVSRYVKYAWTGLGASYGPLILLGLYSRSVNWNGAIAGLIVGGFIAATWDWINPYLMDIEVAALVPAFGLSVLTIWGVSRLFPVHKAS